MGGILYTGWLIIVVHAELIVHRMGRGDRHHDTDGRGQLLANGSACLRRFYLYIRSILVPPIFFIRHVLIFYKLTDDKYLRTDVLLDSGMTCTSFIAFLTN